MGNKFLQDPCPDCGNKVALITYLDRETRPIIEYVDHAVCTGCLKTIPLPNEPISRFPHQSE
jgi:predicted RNA-binding Zn-ribbon protein involved in translation (DUF1610 family)